MAGDERNVSASPERARRRDSIGRVLARFTSVLRRKSSSREVPTAAVREVEERPSTPLPVAYTSTPVPSIEATPSTPHQRKSSPVRSPPPKPTPAIGDALEADDDDEDEPDEEDMSFLTANIRSTRTALSDEKTRLMFDKYGVKYGNRRPPTEEPASKVRRVERPLRIRVHWICHQCDKSFAGHRTCAECGHRKCEECIRQPPRRGRDRGIDTEGYMDTEESTEELIETVPVAAHPDPTPADEEEDLPDEIANPSAFLFTIHARSTGGLQYIHRPTAQILRRMCHQCDTPFPQSNKADCKNCGHARCGMCPRQPLKSLRLGPMSIVEGKMPATEAPAAPPALERVYKKPRQRVRWTCDKCNGPATREKCMKCDHKRCGGCLRDP